MAGCGEETGLGTALGSGETALSGTPSKKAIGKRVPAPGQTTKKAKETPSLQPKGIAQDPFGNAYKPTTPTFLTEKAPPLPAAPRPGDYPSIGSEAKVRLIDAGMGEKKPLRYALRAGTSEPMVMRMTMAMTMNLPGMGEKTMKLPVMVMRGMNKVLSVDGKGTSNVAFSIDSVDVEGGGDPIMNAQLKLELSKFTGIKGTYRFTNRGITTETQMDTTAVTDPSIRKTMETMRQSMEQASSPFPVEAVGNGARWEVLQHIKSEGMKVRQRVEYKLEARSGETVSLSVKLTQMADPQDISTPEMGGMTARLESYSATGGGRLAANLAGITPTGSLTLNNQAKMSIAGQSTSISMNLSIKVGTK